MHVFLQSIVVLVFLLPFISFAKSPSPLREPVVRESNYAVLTDIGYFINSELLDDTFFQYAIVLSLFPPAKLVSPYILSQDRLASFKPIIASLQYYISEEKKGVMVRCDKDPDKCKHSFQKVNGITEIDLATEIVQASFCFGTDPFMVTSKIRQESRFDMSSVSNTGAVGLTQLTGPGLKEILDQLGHRGPKFAYVENRNFIANAIECYANQNIISVFADFPKVNTFAAKGEELEYSGETLKQLKAWILPRPGMLTAHDKKKFVQRQLFMGQVLLKIYLAYSKQLSPKQPTLSHYDSALRMFNGDVARVKYAKEVIKYSKPLNGLL